MITLFKMAYQRTFSLSDSMLTVDSEKLAKALLCLSGKHREVILLHYFLRYKDYQLTALLERPRTTANYQRPSALRQLRKERERIKDEI